MFGYGLLNPDGSPTPLLLDTVRHAETGHLSLSDASNAVSGKQAIGPYQLLQRNLVNMGYGVPSNIVVSDAADPEKSRNIAGTYIAGVNKHHKFNNPIHSLVAYNWGPANAAKWVSEGADFDALPQETKQYLTRAFGYVQNNSSTPQVTAQQGTNAMQLTQAQIEELLRKQAALNLSPQAILAQQHANEYQGLPPSQAPAPILAVPSEDNPDENIDGTPVNRSAILNQIGQGIKAAIATGQNARPQTDYNNDGSDAADEGNQLEQSGILLSPSRAAALGAKAPDAGSRSALGKYQQQQMQAVSANRRDNAVGLPDPKKDNNFLGYSPNDWIYMGSQMAGAAQNGGLAALSAQGKAMREIDTGNAKNALELYKASLKGKKGKTAGDKNAAQISSAIVTGSIDEIIPMIDDDANGMFNRIFGMGGNTTGFFGQLLSKVGGTDANNLRSMLQTIRSNVGFDKLQAMRAASPTGGALGNVSEKENEYLQSVLGNVEQSQSPEQLKRNLLRLREAYLDIVHGYGNRPTGGPNYGTSQSGSGLSQDVMDLMNQYTR